MKKKEEGLDPVLAAGNILPMNFYGALIAWFFMAAVLVGAVVLAVKMSVWFLVVALLLFVLAFAKFGCLSH